MVRSSAWHTLHDRTTSDRLAALQHKPMLVTSTANASPIVRRRRAQALRGCAITRDGVCDGRGRCPDEDTGLTTSTAAKERRLVGDCASASAWHPSGKRPESIRRQWGSIFGAHTDSRGGRQSGMVRPPRCMAMVRDATQRRRLLLADLPSERLTSAPSLTVSLRGDAPIRYGLVAHRRRGRPSRHPHASRLMNSGTISRRKSISSAAMPRDSRSK
jgi:hypothetical protein